MPRTTRTTQRGPQQNDGYSYAKNNPVTRADPNGNCSTSDDHSSCWSTYTAGVFKAVSKGASATGSTGFSTKSPPGDAITIGLTIACEDVTDGVRGLFARDPAAAEGAETRDITNEINFDGQFHTQMSTLQPLATIARDTLGDGRGAVYGTKVHAEFEKLVNGLGREDPTTEVAYKGGVLMPRGTPGSVRLDVVQGPLDQPTAIYDLKTESARLTQARIAQIRSHLPEASKYIPVLAIHP